MCWNMFDALCWNGMPVQGEKMDVGFEEVKSGIEWNTSALDNHAHEPKQRHGVRILSATGGGPSSLNYLFNQEDTK